MKKLLIAAILLLILGLGGYLAYDQLGGNSPITLSLVTTPPETLAGKTFKGTPLDKGLEQAFRSIESLKSLHPGSFLHTLYYVEPAGKRDTLEVFVGINLPFGAPEMESKKFTETRYILAQVSSNKWVMPGPNTIKEKIQDYAEANNLTLSGYYIDKIIGETEVHVIAPLR